MQPAQFGLPGSIKIAINMKELYLR